MDPLELDAPTDHDDVTMTLRDRPIVVRIQRLDEDQYFAFDMGWNKLRRIGTRDVPIRLTDEERATRPIYDADGQVLKELDGSPKTEFVIPDSVLLRQRLQGMSGEEIERYEARCEVEERWAKGFTAAVIRQYVTLAPHQVKVGGAFITTGAEVLHAFRTDKKALQALVWQVYLQNNLTADQKKAFASLPAFGPFFGVSGNASRPPSGPAPEMTAASADASASASSDAATPPAPTTTSSGTAGPCS